MAIDKSKNTVVNIYLSKELKKKLQDIAKGENRSLSNYILNILESIVDEQSENKKDIFHGKTENTDLSQNDTFSTD